MTNSISIDQSSLTYAHAPLCWLRAQSLFAPSPPLKAEDVRRMLADPEVRAGAFERLHTPRPAVGERSSEAYLRGVCEDAADIAGRARVTFFALMGMTHEAPRAQLGRMAIIVNEMMINALAHAHPSGVGLVIDLWCRHDDANNLLVDIADDGVGLPEAFDASQDGGFGFCLMRTLAREMNATLAFRSGPLGLAGRVCVPA